LVAGVDVVSLIIAALAAGAASALQDGASEAVREADARLRDVRCAGAFGATEWGAGASQA
jgi:hypothetical protein